MTELILFKSFSAGPALMCLAVVDFSLRTDHVLTFPPVAHLFEHIFLTDNTLATIFVNWGILRKQLNRC